MCWPQAPTAAAAAAEAGAGGGALADPAAAAALFKDPVRLQKLLQENPALIFVLKSRLGM